MRVVVVGASGNVGTSVLRALVADSDVDSILGVARRRPDWRPPKVEWATADVADDDLASLFRGADAVIHLAWLIQPSRDERRLHAANVTGSRNVIRAVADAAVPTFIYASSVGAYSPGPKDRRVDEGWPVEGIASSVYSRQKAEVEAMLDGFERRSRATRVVRLRPALIFKGEAASEIRRLFAGPFLPPIVGDRRWIPVVPSIAGLRFQAVHSEDVGEAYRLALRRDVRGAFNVAAEGVLDPDRLGALLNARPVPVPARVARALTAASWRLRFQPTPPGWLDLALRCPLLDTTRAREVLGWRPRHTAERALEELLGGIRRQEGGPTPPLDEDAGGSGRLGELRSGVGAR
jgi:UDP-glucose 4-epimerase